MEDAIAVYLFLQDQYEPSLEERAIRADAWQTICHSAKNTIAHELWLKGKNTAIPTVVENVGVEK